MEHAPLSVRSRVTRRTPTILPAPRWTALAVAAAIVVAVLGLGPDRLFTAPLEARATAATGASLIRDGATLPLVAGTALLAGDTVSVATDGDATLRLGGSIARLDGDATVRIDGLGGGIRLDQLAGRAWHRVVLTGDDRYVVATGGLAWAALGTAFDLSRTGTPGGGEQVRLVTAEHAVRVEGPDVALRVLEGRRVTVTLAGGSADVVLDPVGAGDLADPWILANARRDLEAGFAVGWLTAAVAPASSPASTPVTPAVVAPTPAPATPAAASPDASSSTPVATPAAQPAPASTPRPTPGPTPNPTPKPTPKVTPKPTPAPGLGSLALDVAACAGTAYLDWSAFDGAGFHHYVVLRSADSFPVPATYPPPGGVTALDGSFTTDRAATWYADGSLGAGTTAWYRAVAWDAEDRSVAASAAVMAKGKPVAGLGPFGATPVAGGIDATWNAYGGPGACFTYYKVSWSATNPDPSYLGDRDGAMAVGGQGTGAAFVPLEPGTWYVRVEAILASEAGKLLVGSSNAVQVTVGG